MNKEELTKYLRERTRTAVTRIRSRDKQEVGLELRELRQQAAICVAEMHEAERRGYALIRNEVYLAA